MNYMVFSTQDRANTASDIIWQAISKALGEDGYPLSAQTGLLRQIKKGSVWVDFSGTTWAEPFSNESGGWLIRAPDKYKLDGGRVFCDTSFAWGPAGVAITGRDYVAAQLVAASITYTLTTIPT